MSVWVKVLLELLPLSVWMGSRAITVKSIPISTRGRSSGSIDVPSSTSQFSGNYSCSSKALVGAGKRLGQDYDINYKNGQLRAG